MTAMIFATILAAGFFSLVFIGLGGEERVAHLLENLPGGPTGALLFVMASSSCWASSSISSKSR
jgi:TRAP-type mannitol/chloroaromatic compound transport system permease large subunit